MTASEFAMYSNDGLIYVDNPTDTPVTITYLLTARDADGKPLLTMDMMRGGYACGLTSIVTVRAHAQKLPVAIIQPGRFNWMQEDGQWAEGQLSFELTPLYAQKDLRTQDISDQLAAVVEGRAQWNDSYVAARFSWPEDVDRVIYSATLLRYVGDQVVDATGVSANNLDRNEQDWENDMRDMGSFYLYAREKDRADERFEVYVVLAREDKE